MTDWGRAYGDEADAYPVAPGEVWQVGPHRLACLDLERQDQVKLWLAELVTEGGCAMAFTDPPWNAGNARAFRTKSTLDGPQGRAVDFPALMQRVIGTLAVAVPVGPVWVEMGQTNSTAVMAELRAAGWRGVERWPMTYYGSRPCHLLRAVREESQTIAEAAPAGQDEAFVTAFAVHRDSRPGERVFDPCTGRGLTAVSAASSGRIFRGSELAPRRASVTLARLAAIVGARATREGRL